MRLPTIIVLVSLLTSPMAAAEKAAVDLATLVAESDAIVVGEVIAVDGPDGERVARLRVERTLKGTALDEVKFRASPSWLCDSTTAALGERVLLFLEGSGKTAHVVASGTGRMVLVTDGARHRVKLDEHDFLPPPGLPIDVQEASRAFGPREQFFVDEAPLFDLIRRCVAGEALCGSATKRSVREAWQVTRARGTAPAGSQLP